MNVVRMQFFNHTRCACVSRGTLQMTLPATAVKASYSDSQEELERPSRRALVENQNDWRAPTEEPHLEKDEELTASSQLRRYFIYYLFRLLIIIIYTYRRYFYWNIRESHLLLVNFATPLYTFISIHTCHTLQKWLTIRVEL